MKIEDFAADLRAVMEAEGITAKTLLEKAPSGFWGMVSNRTGLAADNARMFWSRHKAALIEILGAKNDTNVKPDTVNIVDKVISRNTDAGSRDNDVKVVREELLNTIADLEIRLTRLLEERIRAAHAGPGVEGDMLDDPPRPAREGKKFKDRETEYLRCLIDKKLYERVEKDAGHYGGNISRTVDAILWRYYNRPRLSYEKPDQ